MSSAWTGDRPKREQVTKEALTATADMKWISNPGPQTDGYFCKADVLLYGGEAAGGKTDLLAGLALTQAADTGATGFY